MKKYLNIAKINADYLKTDKTSIYIPMIIITIKTIWFKALKNFNHIKQKLTILQYKLPKPNELNRLNQKI